MKKVYLRSTRNLYYKDENGIRVFYSYTTPVAFMDRDNTLVISENKWSVTTAKHLNWIEDFCGVERKLSRTKNSVFKESLKSRQSQNGQDISKARADNRLKTANMVSAMFGLMCGDDKETKVKYQKRFLQTVPGISFPDDWDSLPTEEKEKRLNKVQEASKEKI